MVPSVGRVVHYRLSDSDAEQVTRRRDDAKAKMDWHRTERTGAMVHIGNPVKSGDVYPMVIVRVWSDDPDYDTAIQGQVLLDGSDTLWVTSRQQGDLPGQWFEPPRV